MPLFEDVNEAGMEQHTIAGSSYGFTATGIAKLGATEYTLALIAIDVSGSTAPFAAELRAALITAVQACKKSPRSENLLLRNITFSTRGVTELHGYKPLSEINPSAYPEFRPYGGTPLFNATYDAVGSMVTYGETLADSDFLCNGIVFLITDGANTEAGETPTTIKRLIEKARKAEKLESLVTVLIGINAHEFGPELKQFEKDAALTQYIDVGDATPGKLAKLADFVSQSVSSTSQALGTQGPSQSIATTI